VFFIAIVLVNINKALTLGVFDINDKRDKGHNLFICLTIISISLVM